MLRFLAKRVAWSVLVLWFVLSVTFAINFLLPADPVRAMLGPHASPDTIARVRHNLHLDESFLSQYWHFVARIAHGDLGESFRLQMPVSQLIVQRIWPTAQLALGAIFLQLLIGVPLGVIAASRRNRAPDAIAQVIALVGQSAPTFFLGPLFIYLFAYRTGLFPISGYGVGVLDRLWHLFLPALTLAVGGLAFYARIVRAELIEHLDEDYVRTARAKGLSRFRVVNKHALRNALLPVVTLVGLDLGVLMGGAIVTEFIFGWPGLGRESVLSIVNLDLPVVLAVVLLSAVAILVANLLVDIAYALLDPRVRLE
jgi:peptide/nickel transport system permease protein